LNECGLAERLRDRNLPSMANGGGGIGIQKRVGLYGPSSQAGTRLSKPFKCPSSATAARSSDKPARKRRKVDYSGTDGTVEDDYNKPWTSEERLALANRDVNRFGVFKIKDKEVAFKQRFSVPLIDKSSPLLNSSRVAPTLGLRRGATFVIKPLHDPSGEFAIVLYDPTTDDQPEQKKEDDGSVPEEKPKLDEPIMHKSLADILGLKKQVETRPKVPVVIDPKLAKVLRPHQIEGVKVRSPILKSQVSTS
jgi:DNA repair and recombination protein RAD54 and RAD54-like protein